MGSSHASFAMMGHNLARVYVGNKVRESVQARVNHGGAKAAVVTGDDGRQKAAAEREHEEERLLLQNGQEFESWETVGPWRVSQKEAK